MIYMILCSTVHQLTDVPVTSAASVHDDCHKNDPYLHLCEGRTVELIVVWITPIGKDDLKAYAR